MANDIIVTIQEKMKLDDNIIGLYLSQESENILFLNCLIEGDIKRFLNHYLDFFITIKPIIHYELANNSIFVYYENNLFLKFECSNNYKINHNVKMLINKNNIQIPINDALTNKELIIQINKFIYSLIEYYNARKQEDTIYSFHKTIKVVDNFIIIYRAFFDSYNAKKEYKDLRKTMDKKNYANLETVFKNIKFGQTIETVLILINIVDQLIKNLPLTLLNDIDIGFYNLIKKQLYTLN